MYKYVASDMSADSLHIKHAHFQCMYNNCIYYDFVFSEEIRSANFIAADVEGVDCLVLDRELVYKPYLLPRLVQLNGYN